MSKTAIIVQARFGSSRLPGKVLRPLGGKTVLAHVLERCKRVVAADVVCCAVADDGESDPVAEEARRTGVAVFRGSRTDVLARYAGAARYMNAETVMRVTSDCPVIDPVVCSDVLNLLGESSADYVCNNMPPSWPHGLDCEAFTAEVLFRAEREAKMPEEREHVTPWMRDHPKIRRADLPGPGGAWVEQRWTLDYPEDMKFFEALFDAVPGDPAVSRADDFMKAVGEHPDIANINRSRRDRGRIRDRKTG